MPRLILINDPTDPRVADYVSLREVALRTSVETAGGLFIAEGDKVIRRAVEAGCRLRSCLLAERWVEPLADSLADAEVPVYVVTEELAEQITGFHVHRGALASVHRPMGLDPEQVMRGRRIVVVEDIVDHANLGAIIRSAAGLGWNGVMLSPRSADPLYRRSIKTSMGAVFSLPWARLEEWATAPEALRTAGFQVVAMALRDDSVSLADYAASIAPDQRIALLLGTEGAGLSETWLAGADAVVRIPMGHGIDSLNVASAAAVACYALGDNGQSSG